MSAHHPLTVFGSTQWLKAELTSESPEDDARFLLSYVLNKSFTWLRTWPDERLNSKQLSLLKKVVRRRNQGEPIAYITGQRDFWTLTLNTNPSTLIPRPETELIVELAIQFLAERQSHFTKQNILDLGTGTGAIALAIASERQRDKMIAIDFEKQAVELAQQNAKLNGITNIEVIQSDWFKNIPNKQFDLIVSNPPYIEDDDPHLSQGDLVFEPRSALVAADSGLADIKIIIDRGVDYLAKGGRLMIEHGYQQGQAVREIFKENGYQGIKTEQDLAGLDRVTIGTY